MPNQNTITEHLWKEMATMPAFHGGLLTKSHRQALVGACLRDYHNYLATTLPEYNAPSGGLILPEADFDGLMNMNGRVKNHGPIYRQTLWALYRDLLDRDGTNLFWRMYYCNRKGPEWVDGKDEMVKQSRCYSLFCPSCRQEIQKRRATRAKKHFGQLPMNRLHFLTVLHKCATDLDGIKQDVERFKGKVKRAFGKAKHLSRIEMQGAMEIDLKHPSLYQVATMDGNQDYRQHCADALGALGIYLGYLHSWRRSEIDSWGAHLLHAQTRTR